MFLLWVLGKRGGEFSNLLDVGCGTGFVLEGIRQAYPCVELFGSDYFEEGLIHARLRIPSASFAQVDARAIADTERYDVIVTLDVIEHIEEDELVLKNLSRALKLNGVLLLTVPQHRWLWSTVDEQACHVRRYSQAELVGKVEGAGLKVKYVTSFVSLLVPLMWLVRLWARTRRYDPMSEFRIPDWLNVLLETVMNIELGLLKRGVRFAVGGSLLLLAGKS